MGEQVSEEKPEERRGRQVHDRTRPHLRRFFECKELPPGKTVHGGPWKEPEHGLPTRKER